MDRRYAPVFARFAPWQLQVVFDNAADEVPRCAERLPGSGRRAYQRPLCVRVDGFGLLREFVANGRQQLRAALT